MHSCKSSLQLFQVPTIITRYHECKQGLLWCQIKQYIHHYLQDSPARLYLVYFQQMLMDVSLIPTTFIYTFFEYLL